jgi:predicted site-specific integrase-resolvase
MNEKPLANTEVLRLIKQHMVKKQDNDNIYGAHASSTEQGNELRRQTLDYIERFNEFEVDDQVRDIRK